VHRVQAKYGASQSGWHREQAEAAFERALKLNPTMSLAHNLYTNFEVETLGRARLAMRRLIERAQSSPADPELFTGLVLACRYCGLLAASLAADRHARRLDPAVRTSVAYTHFMLGDWDRARATEIDEAAWVTNYALPLMGRESDAIAAYLEAEQRPLPPVMRSLLRATRFALLGQRDECVEISRQLLASAGFDDPEGLYFQARNLVRVQALDFALETLERVVDRGFHCARILLHDPWLEPVRGVPRFQQIVARVEGLVREAEAEYIRQGGERLLGPPN
jgi:tetratricopeptide (TPR) repeat protein